MGHLVGATHTRARHHLSRQRAMKTPLAAVRHAWPPAGSLTVTASTPPPRRAPPWQVAAAGDRGCGERHRRKAMAGSGCRLERARIELRQFRRRCLHQIAAKHAHHLVGASVDAASVTITHSATSRLHRTEGVCACHPICRHWRRCNRQRKKSRQPCPKSE